MAKLQDFVISHVIKMKWLDGYRTYAGGAFFVLTGVGILANQVATGVYDHATFEKGIALIGAGLVAIGGAGKMDKLTDATKEGK